MKNIIFSFFKYVGVQLLIHVPFIFYGIAFYHFYQEAFVLRDSQIAQAEALVTIAERDVAGLRYELEHIECAPGDYFKYDELKKKYDNAVGVAHRMEESAKKAGTSPGDFILWAVLLFIIACAFAFAVLRRLMFKGIMSHMAYRDKYDHNLLFLMLMPLLKPRKLRIIIWCL